MLLVTFGCKNEVAEPLSTEALTELQPKTTPLDIALEASVEPTIEEVDFDDSEPEEARNLNYGVTKSQKNGKDVFKVERKGLEEKPLYSLCVIKPKTGANASNTYYVKLTWQKKKGQNYFFVKEKSITETTGKTIKLAKGTRWHICGILTYNKDNVRATNVAFDPNKTAGTALSGTIAKDIPLYFDWQDLGVDDVGAWRFNPENTAPAKITVKPLGVMLRVSVQNNAAFKMRLKTLKLQSNGLIAGAGYVGWSGGTDTPLNKHIREAYKANNPNAREEVFTLSNNVDVEAGRTYDKFFLVWVFPKDLRGATTEKKYTKVMVSAKRLEGTTEKTYPKMNYLYGFWSTTNNLQAGKRHHLPVTLYRPKLPLEYLTGYVAGNGFAEGDARWFLTSEYNSFSRAGYRKPTAQDVRGIIGVYTDVKFSGSAVVTKDMGNFRIGSKTSFAGTYTATFKNGNPVTALRFDDGEGQGKRLYYSLSQYKKDPNSGVLSALYLGPNYKGSFEETITPAFLAAHDADIIKKRYYLGTSYTQTYGPGDSNEPLSAGVMISYIEKVQYDYSLWRIDPTNVPQVSEVFNGQIGTKRYQGKRNKKERKAPAVLVHTHDNFTENPLF